MGSVQKEDSHQDLGLILWNERHENRSFHKKDTHPTKKNVNLLVYIYLCGVIKRIC